MSLLFNMLTRFVTAFLPRSKHLLISWLQSLSTVILEPKKIKSGTVSIFSPSICHEVMGSDAMSLVLWMLSFKSASPLSSFTFIKLFSSSLLSAIRVVSPAYLRLLIFLVMVSHLLEAVPLPSIFVILGKLFLPPFSKELTWLRLNQSLYVLSFGHCWFEDGHKSGLHFNEMKKARSPSFHWG